MGRWEFITFAVMSEKAWFADWFNSTYYHKLYQHRGSDEADSFIPALLQQLEMDEGSEVLDLACGKGRHARSFHEHGMKVTGVDLAPESIAEARLKSHPDIRFEVGDMRSFELGQHYDLVCNLFTSFGYFDDTSDNERVLRQIARHLRPDGRLVIDFLNASRVLANLVPENVQEAGGITFHIERRLEAGQIRKKIAFEDKGEHFEFEERVQALDVASFEQLLSASGFRVENLFGDYALHPYHQDAERLIIVASLA